MTKVWDFVGRQHRPTVIGNKHVIAAGHYLAAQAGFLILEAGGNAIDAGVAAGICLNVLEGQQCSFSGVAPIMIRDRAGKMVTIDGLGVWPKAASCEFFTKQGFDVVPPGILQTVVPGAPDAWLTALDRFGTMTFREVAGDAIRFAREGFPVHPELAFNIDFLIEDFPEGSEAERIFRPDGVTPAIGQILVQTDLADTLQFLSDEEASASGDRSAGIAAVRRAFYEGDIAQKIARHQHENGGLLTLDDMSAFRVTIEAPLKIDFQGTEIFCCGPWCQGPLLLQQLRLLEGFDLRKLGHNSAEFIHVVTEAIKLTAADREAYYGDPKFINPPMGELLSEAYNQTRRQSINLEKAWPDMPPAGVVSGRPATNVAAAGLAHLVETNGARDTTYVCVVDSQGNAFSATPSDGLIRSSPIVPGLGLGPSARGVQSRLDRRHPSCVEPGKRPRLTPNPAMAVRVSEFVMPFGTPGGDQQTQAMLQFVLNVLVFEKGVQLAVEEPRFYSNSFPDSFSPHGYTPGLLRLEKPIPGATAEALQRLGHKVQWWPATMWPKTSVCAVLSDSRTGVKYGAADHRRTAAALGR